VGDQGCGEGCGLSAFGGRGVFDPHRLFVPNGALYKHGFLQEPEPIGESPAGDIEVAFEFGEPHGPDHREDEEDLDRPGLEELQTIQHPTEESHFLVEVDAT
jgi:hypothetical protein